MPGARAGCDYVSFAAFRRWPEAAEIEDHCPADPRTQTHRWPGLDRSACYSPDQSALRQVWLKGPALSEPMLDTEGMSDPSHGLPLPPADRPGG